ncbi:hypothetical protein JTB14_028117 [Gonioctena quinquepunctata]|nr:hypothetical protein JTB14_028117 [Gonioctena quinquepunctata]
MKTLPEWRQALPQIIAVSVKNTILLSYGLTLGFTTILIPALSEDDPSEIIHLGQEALSWIDDRNVNDLDHLRDNPDAIFDLFDEVGSDFEVDNESDDDDPEMNMKTCGKIQQTVV